MIKLKSLKEYIFSEDDIQIQNSKKDLHACKKINLNIVVEHLYKWPIAYILKDSWKASSMVWI
jgi:hypothetical protein